MTDNTSPPTSSLASPDTPETGAHPWRETVRDGDAGSETASPSPEEITEEVERARKHLHTALGSINLLAGHIPNSAAIAERIKQALAILPKRRATRIRR